MKNKVFDLNSTFVIAQPDQSLVPTNFTPTFFEDLEKNFDNFEKRWLISHFSFNEDWPTWEIHPVGDEIVYLLSGMAELILENNGTTETLYLNQPGSYIIIPKNTWHTAKINTPTTMLFITPGQNTQNKPC